MIDDRLPRAQRPPAAGGALTTLQGRYPDTRRAQREHGEQHLGRGGQGPPVIDGQPLDQFGVVNLASVVRVIAVQPGLARMGGSA
jgi:hypothetical protein